MKRSPRGVHARSLPLAMILALALGGARCNEPRSAAGSRDPQPGDFVRMRGTLAEDVDCRLLRADNGHTYSLSWRLRSIPNGTKACIHGTMVEISQCLTQPMIEVQAVRPLSTCP